MRHPSRFLALALLGAGLLMATIAYANVELNYFVGRWIATDAVLLEWESASELDNGGFNVWRSEQDLPINSQGQIDTAQATKLNSVPITNPPVNCSIQGDMYSFTDSTVDSEETTYYYYLESLPCTSATSTFYGNADSSGGLEVIRDFSIYLPLIGRGD